MNEEEINKKFENADLTTVYMNGFYDGEKKWKDKIKDKIYSFDNDLQKADANGDEETKERIWCATSTLYELLEEDNK